MIEKHQKKQSEENYSAYLTLHFLLVLNGTGGWIFEVDVKNTTMLEKKQNFSCAWLTLKHQKRHSKLWATSVMNTIDNLC